MKRQCDKIRDAELVAYLADPDDDALRDVHAHVAECEECAAELRAWRGLRSDPLIDDSRPVAEHPDEENLVAYCDDPASLGAVLRTEIQAHLAICATCRDETKVPAEVRVEKTRAPQASDTFETGDDAPADDDALSIPHPAVIQASGWAQRIRQPGVMFALLLTLSLPVIGMYAVESGVLLQSETAEFETYDALETLGEVELDAATFTARVRNVDRDAPHAQRDTLAKKKESAQLVATLSASGEQSLGEAAQLFDESTAELAAVVVVEPVTQQAAVEPPAEEEEEVLPAWTHREQPLTPEQLMAMLETERYVKKLERTAIEVPEVEEDHARTGAALIDLTGSFNNDTTDVDEGLRSARMAPGSMILGVRKLGTAPVRGSMLASGGGLALLLHGQELRGRSRVHFVPGSSYVFYNEDVARGLELSFSLPLVEGAVQRVDARVFEVGTGREFRKQYAAPADYAQAAPMVSLVVPAGWFTPGRYSVELTDPKDGVSDARSINIRILESPATRPTVAAPTQLE